MIAYKFLRPGAVGPFSGLRWPTPSRGPGSWVTVGPEPLRGCGNGIHAVQVAGLPYWLAEELWVTELEEPVESEGHLVLGRRGRLLEQVTAWGPETKREFGADCALRAEVLLDEARTMQVELELASDLEGYAADAATFAHQGSVATAAYVAAHCAGRLSAAGATSGVGYQTGFDRERADQASWLATRLELPAEPA